MEDQRAAIGDTEDQRAAIGIKKGASEIFSFGRDDQQPSPDKGEYSSSIAGNDIVDSGTINAGYVDSPATRHHHQQQNHLTDNVPLVKKSPFLENQNFNYYNLNNLHANQRTSLPKNSKIRLDINGLLGMLKLRSKIPLQEELYLIKPRIHKSPFQKAVLHRVLNITPFPSTQTREDLALLLNHTSRGIQIWFQNKRNKIGLTKEEIRREKFQKRTLDILELVEIVNEFIPEKMKTEWNDLINRRIFK